MTDWNASLYLKFEKERTQPAKDLINRLSLENPRRVIDIGCGPGNSTLELKQKYPSAKIIGLDSSQSMLEKAAKNKSDVLWIKRDASENLTDLGTFDLVFSNAAIQWFPDQQGLLKNL